MKTVDYVNFSAQIANKLAVNGIFDDSWFFGQRDRISMMWNAGETVDSAYETISQFAMAQVGSKTVKQLNPLDEPHCLGVKYID